MVPAPRKPTPLMTCAPMRVTSVTAPTASWASAQRVVSMRYSYWLSIMVVAAPRHTSI